MRSARILPSICAGIGIIGLLSVAASAASPTVTAIIKARQANYKEIGGAFKAINDEIKSGSPDLNIVRPLTRDLAIRATNTLRQFPRGSGPESGLKTRAKAEIWRNQADFVTIQKKMVAAAKAIESAAGSGNGAAMVAARDTLGATCKACHDKYRVSQ